MAIQCWRQLAGFYGAEHRVEEAKLAYIRACDLFSACYPYCLQYAWCLFNLGSLYQDSNDFPPAETRLLLSIPLLFPRFSATTDASPTLQSSTQP